MTYRQAIAAWQRQIDTLEGKQKLLARYELRLLQLSQGLTIADWRQIRDKEYWLSKAAIDRQDGSAIDKELQQARLLGLSIVNYLKICKNECNR